MTNTTQAAKTTESTMTATIFVPRKTPSTTLLALSRAFPAADIVDHDHSCASVDCDDEYRGCQILAQVNAILWPDEDSDDSE